MKQNTKSIREKKTRKTKTPKRMVRSGGRINLLKIGEEQNENARREERAMTDVHDIALVQNLETNDEENEEIFQDENVQDNHLREFDEFEAPVYDSFHELRDPSHMETNFPLVLIEYVEVMQNVELMRALRREGRLIDFFMDIGRLIRHAETDTERELVERFLLNYESQNYPTITMATLYQMGDMYQLIMDNLNNNENSYDNEQAGGRRSKKTRNQGSTTKHKKSKSITKRKYRRKTRKSKTK